MNETVPKALQLQITLQTIDMVTLAFSPLYNTCQGFFKKIYFDS